MASSSSPPAAAAGTPPSAAAAAAALAAASTAGSSAASTPSALSSSSSSSSSTQLSSLLQLHSPLAAPPSPPPVIPPASADLPPMQKRPSATRDDTGDDTVAKRAATAAVTAVAASFANGTSPATPPESVDHPLDGAAANKKRKQGFRPATDCVFVSETGVRDPYGASAVPIYQTATFKQSSATDMGEYDYTRSGNPTRSNLESHLAKILKAKRAFATSTGMTALDVITRLVPSGHHIVAGNDLYGGSNRLLAHLARTNNIVVHHVDTTNIDEIRPVLDPTKTALVLLESPTNPCMRIADIRAISDLVHTICSTALVVVDNTMMSPVLMNPLELGADVEYHSATKFLSGHHDLMAGVVAVNNDALADRIAFVVNATGTGLSPFDSFLLLRGVKTLHLRVAAQSAAAERIARWLAARRPDAGYEVLYPTLSSHPQHDLHTSQASGGGAVLSLLTGSVEKSRAIVEATTLWGISVSFGCVNSLISMPCHMSHASIPKEVREARGLREDLVRLCVGIEDTDDLIEDLERALAAAEALHAE